jgi:hypothetical protein
LSDNLAERSTKRLALNLRRRLRRARTARERLMPPSGNETKRDDEKHATHEPSDKYCALPWPTQDDLTLPRLIRRIRFRFSVRRLGIGHDCSRSAPSLLIFDFSNFGPFH